MIVDPLINPFPVVPEQKKHAQKRKSLAPLVKKALNSKKQKTHVSTKIVDVAMKEAEQKEDQILWLTFQEFQIKLNKINILSNFPDKLKAFKRLFRKEGKDEVLWVTVKDTKNPETDVHLKLYFYNDLFNSVAFSENDTFKADIHYYINAYESIGQMGEINTRKPLLRLRLSAKNGELIYLHDGNKLSGTEVGSLYKEMDNAFNLDMFLYDDAKKRFKGLKNGYLMLKMSAIGDDLAYTWYQKRFGFLRIPTCKNWEMKSLSKQEEAQAKERGEARTLNQCEKVYNEALNRVRKMTLATIYSFYKKEVKAIRQISKTICNIFKLKKSEFDFFNSQITLFELAKTCHLKATDKGLSAEEKEEAEKWQHTIYTLLFTPYDVNDNNEIAKRYWEDIYIIDSTRVFMKKRKAN